MKLKSTVYAPILFGVMLLLAGVASALSRVIEKVSVDAFLSSAMLQLIVFLLPLAFYCRVMGINAVSAMNLRPVGLRRIPLLVNLSLVFFVGALVLRYAGLFLFDEAMVETPGAIYFSAKSENAFLHFLGVVVLPAILEEAAFRGILMKGYREFGAFWSVSVTSIMFSMLHLSAENFVYYLFMGVILGIMTLVSNSVLPAMGLHVAINASYEYLRPAVVEYLRQAGKSIILPYILLGIFMSLFVFTFSGLEKLYEPSMYNEILDSRRELLKKELKKARSLQKQEVPETKGKAFFRSFREIYLSPAFLVCIVLFFFLISDVLK